MPPPPSAQPHTRVLHTPGCCSGKDANGWSTHLGDHQGRQERAAGTPLCTRESCRHLDLQGESWRAWPVVLHPGESQCGDGGAGPCPLGALQTGSELVGLPTLGALGCLHSPGRGDGSWVGEHTMALSRQGDQSQTHLPQPGTPGLGPMAAAH